MQNLIVFILVLFGFFFLVILHGIFEKKYGLDATSAKLALGYVFLGVGIVATIVMNIYFKVINSKINKKNNDDKD